MATIKSYTDLEQSKKLAEILSLESADMYWKNGVSDKYIQCFTPFVTDEYRSNVDYDYDAPCWSLAALLSVLPNNKHITTALSRGGWKIEPVEYIDKWFCEYEDEDSHCKAFTVSADNPVDACVAMVERLHELNLM